MGKDAVRLLVCAIASLVLIVASTLVMDWFRIGNDELDAMGVGTLSIDLRAAHACAGPQHVCASVSLGQFRGFFPASATITLFSSLSFAILLVWQAGRRLIGTVPSVGLTK